MAQGTVKLLSAPAYLPGTAVGNTANIYTSCGGSSLIKDIIQQITVANDTASAATFTLYIGGTGGHVAGTEIFNGYSLAANTSQTFNVMIPLTSTQFLTGWSNTSSALTITVSGQQIVL